MRQEVRPVVQIVYRVGVDFEALLASCSLLVVSDTPYTTVAIQDASSVRVDGQITIRIAIQLTREPHNAGCAQVVAGEPMPHSVPLGVPITTATVVVIEPDIRR